MLTGGAGEPRQVSPPLGRKRWTHVLPIAFIMYTVAHFDRANIAVALPGIVQEFSLSPLEAGMVGSAFGCGYFLSQLLSGWLVLRFGTRNLIGWAQILWGLGAIALGFAQDYHQIIVLRFALGLFQGPVFAATLAFLAQWFRTEERAQAFAFWNLSSPVGAFLAGPLTGLVLAHYDWHVMMIAEGLPAWIWAIIWWWRVPSSLAEAPWLPNDERAQIAEALDCEQRHLGTSKSAPWWSVAGSPIVLCTLIGFALINLLITGFTFWLPTILRSVEGMSVTTAGVLSGLPFAASMAGILIIARRSDRHRQERRWHAALPTLFTGLAMIASAFVPVGFFHWQIAIFMVVGFTMKMFLPLIFAHLTEVLPREQSVPAIALTSSVGNLLGGVAGPMLIGGLAEATSGFVWPLCALGIAGLAAGGTFSLVRHR
ncbi:MFS transporter [Telmatospirillum sp.]|uniref:MFS transporter n=1 Tax=Telmatospirillum sp. TaxID=2079197 RepID=UPI002846F012|nr:MFS transporter [Telmatospirillum sp.]MDR3440465.1 MFS transporter [Telmatospirillum sp.]